jgi:hypothetical protein
MWLETATVVMTLIFGVADGIISEFTVSGIAITGVYKYRVVLRP